MCVLRKVFASVLICPKDGRLHIPAFQRSSGTVSKHVNKHEEDLQRVPLCRWGRLSWPSRGCHRVCPFRGWHYGCRLQSSRQKPGRENQKQPIHPPGGHCQMGSLHHHRYIPGRPTTSARYQWEMRTMCVCDYTRWPPRHIPVAMVLRVGTCR